MTSVEKHDKKIKETIIIIKNAVDKEQWRFASDQSKYLLKLIKERKDFNRYKKQSKVILTI